MKNFGNESSARSTCARRPASSVNTVYAALNIDATPEKSSKAAKDAGVRSTLEPNMANVLGTDYVTVLDMATAYATIAAEGVRANPYIVKEIRFQDKSVPTIKAKVVKQQVFDKDLMSDVIDAMTYPVEGGTARYVGQNLGRPAAGKTGTSESFRSAWFNGYVPQLQAAVGLYRSGKDGEELPMEDLPNAGSITGGTYPARIWTAYMKAALDGQQGGPVPGAGRHQQERRPAAAHDDARRRRRRARRRPRRPRRRPRRRAPPTRPRAPRRRSRRRPRPTGRPARRSRSHRPLPQAGSG